MDSQNIGKLYRNISVIERYFSILLYVIWFTYCSGFNSTQDISVSDCALNTVIIALAIIGSEY